MKRPSTPTLGAVPLVLCLALLGACGSEPTAPPDRTVRDPVVHSVIEVGAIAEPSNVATRDGGASARQGDEILWFFGDTFFHPASSDGVNYRTNTAALAPLTAPLAVTEPLDAAGAPFQAIPFTAEEKAYNDSTASPNERIALWPGGLISRGAEGIVGFVNKLYVHPGLLNYDHIGVELVRFAPGSTTATRMGPLFGADDPVFDIPMVRADSVYVYGNIESDGSGGIGVARAPLDRLNERDAYRAWNGSDWVSDLSETAMVFNLVPGEASVAWNEYLGQFIAVHSWPLSERVVIRTASAPEGPWSAPKDLFAGQTPVDGFNYAGRHHPELDLEDGRVIFVSYYHPLPGFLQGELVLVRVELE